MKLWEWVRGHVYRPAFFVNGAFTLKQGLKFYAGLIGIFVIAQVILASPGTVRFFQGVFSGEWDRQVGIVTDIFPEELELELKRGVVSTNMIEPYTIAVPIEWRTSDADSPENLLVINTTKSIATDDFAREDTWLILGEQSIGWYNAEKSEYRIYDLTDTLGRHALTVDHETYAQFVVQASGYIKLALLIGVCLLPFLMYGLFFVGYLVYLIFGALLVWLAVRFRGYTISYGQAYLAGMYLLPLPLCYHIALVIFGTVGMPLAFTLVLFVATLINFPKKLTPLPVTVEEKPAIE